jgi:hypothetical protein
MLARLFSWTGSSAVVWPLIQEARDRQRRRRVALAQIAALGAVFGLATMAAGHGGGGGLASFGNLGTLWPPETPASVRTDVSSVIAGFDGALARRDFATACSLVDPGMGMTTVRTATSDVGIEGTCEQRLAGFVRFVGPVLLDELQHASLSDIQLGGSERQGYAAAALIHVPDRIVEKGHWWPIIGVSKAAPHARPLITCPPLLCTWRFLNDYSLQVSARRGARL